MQSLQQIKKGDTFEFKYSLPIDVGAAVSSISCDLVNGKTVVENLTVSSLGSDGINYSWILSATALQTELWPSRTLLSDIKHVFSDGKISRSETFKVPVIDRETV